MRRLLIFTMVATQHHPRTSTLSTYNARLVWISRCNWNSPRKIWYDTFHGNNTNCRDHLDTNIDININDTDTKSVWDLLGAVLLNGNKVWDLTSSSWFIRLTFSKITSIDLAVSSRPERVSVTTQVKVAESETELFNIWKVSWGSHFCRQDFSEDQNCTYSQPRHDPGPVPSLHINLEFLSSLPALPCQQDLLIMSHHLGLGPLLQLPQPDDDGGLVGGVGGGGGDHRAGELDCIPRPASDLTHQTDVVGPS